MSDSVTRSSRATHDRVGLALLTGFLSWAWISAVVNGTTAWPVTGLAALTVLAYGAGRSRAPDRTEVVAGGLALLVLMSPGFGWGTVLSGRAVAPPLGYSNADGALFAVGVAAAAIAAVSASRYRHHWWAVSVFLTLATVASLSRAAALVAAVVLLVAVFARTSSRRLRRWSALAAPVLVAVLVAITVGMAVGRHPLPAENGVEQALSTRRVELWHDATTLIAQRPVFGVGPSRFDDTSPTALAHRDTRWAHSEYLQVAAEEGIPGAMLLAGLLCWVYDGLRCSRRNPRVVSIGIAALTALAVQAAIDYVGHFPLVVVGAAVVAGLASGGRSDRTASLACDSGLPSIHKGSTASGSCLR